MDGTRNMEAKMKDRVLRYQPYIYKDKLDPFPIRYIGCTIFSEKKRSDSFPKWVVDPAGEGAKEIIEYAIYYDYDIQHLYDLEHIWVAIDEKDEVVDCWSSFHGQRFRAAGVSFFKMEGTHPILYSQPGKHAMLPHPELFELLPQLRASCTSEAGGGLLLPALLNGAVETNDCLDAKITAYIRGHYTFQPSMEFVREQLMPEQFITWPELLHTIPELISKQINIICR